MKYEPKPCPFCGGKPAIIKNYTGEWVVHCVGIYTRGCDIAPGTEPYKTRKEAVQVWNKREETI